jgi:hypothetical protein
MMNKTNLAFLLGVSLSALVAMWLRVLTGEIELLEVALSGVVANMQFDDEIEPAEEWGD